MERISSLRRFDDDDCWRLNVDYVQVKGNMKRMSSSLDHVLNCMIIDPAQAMPNQPYGTTEVHQSGRPSQQGQL